MRKRLKILALPALVLALATCWLIQTSAETHSFIWRATNRQGAVYLVGSVHLLTKDFYPLDPVLETAYRDSTLLVEEVDMGEMLAPDAQMTLLTRGMLPAGQSLDNVVAPATMALVTQKVAGLGLPLEPLKRFKPWMLTLQLLGLEWLKAGFDADLGLDKHFYDLAKKDNKPVQGLETIDFQIAQFDGMSMGEQDHLLSESLKELDTEQASVTTLAAAWRSGDAPAVERVVLQDLKSDPPMYRRLLVDRNRTWLPQLEALFTRSSRTFVVVGAAHLVGPDGLLQMLKARGYTVQ